MDFIPHRVARHIQVPVFFWVSLFLPLHAESIRVGTYNLENYLLENRVIEARWRPDYPKPESEKNALREILLEVNPDILLFQEMGPQPFLEELRADLQAYGLFYEYRTVIEAVDPERHLALLSKLPFELSGDMKGRSFPYFGERIPVKRGLLEAHFQIGETGFTLFGVHLKSRYTDRKDDPLSAKRRAGEARTIRNYIREKFPPEDNPHYLIAGDFNDTRSSATLNYFLSVGKQTLSVMVPAADSRGEVWTYYYERDDVYSRVDYFLASPAFFPAIQGKRGWIADGEAALAAGDHRMVWIDLALNSGN